MKMIVFDDKLIINFNNISSVERVLETYSETHRIQIREIGLLEPRILEYDNVEQCDSDWQLIKEAIAK